MKKFKLFKTLLIAIGLLVTSINTAWAGTRRIYFDYSAVTWWSDNTTIANPNNDKYVVCHAWDGSGSTDYEMHAVAGESNLAYCDINDSYTSLCFGRGTLAGSGWWNSTQNRSDVGTNNRFKVKNATGDWGDDKGKYLWADSDAGVRWAPGSTIDGLIDVNNPHNQAFSFSGSTGTYSVTLSAHCTYQFKILEGTTAYGLDNNVFTGPISNYASSTSGYAYRLATAGAGTYTFTWDNSTHKLSISFPSVNHPSIDYVYLYDHSWGYEKQYVHVWNSASGIASTTWPGTKVPNTTTINGETFYYCAPGDYANFQFSDGTNSNKTGDLSKSDGYGQYQKSISSSWGWRTWSFTITLNAQNSDEGSTNPDNPTVEFNGTALSGSAGAVTPPTRIGYTFGGYWSNSACNGVKVINENGSWAASAAGYTDSDRKWIHEGGTATLFAKWTPITYTVAYYSNDASYSGTATGTTSSSSHTYDVAKELTSNGFSLNGYSFAGWGTDEGTSAATYTNGQSVSNLSSTQGATVNLYARWTPVLLTSANDGNWNEASNWSPACVPTIEHDVTIANAVSVSDAQVAKSVNITTGTLTIKSTGSLEVAGTITNTVSSKINVAAGGALIFDNSAGSTCATVDLSLEDDRWQMIAIPVGYVNVSEAFYGSSVYTYVWKYGEGWERRGYYDGVSAFESVLIKGCTGYTFSGALVSTNDQSFTASYDASKVSGDVTMYGNSWPAPIKISEEIEFDGIAENAIHFFTGTGWDGGVIGDVIPALQGFAVIAEDGGGSVTIPYSAVRAVESEDRNAPLYAPKRTASNDLSDHITVYVTTNDMKTRIRLFENEQFSDEIDKGYEALYMDGEGIAGELYAQAERKMNVLATNNLEGTVLGFVPGEATNYTISFEGDGKGYYLNDVATGESTLIDEANTYDFKSDENTNATRFVVSKMPLMPTGVDEVADGSKARKQMIDGTLYIIRDGRIYDATGSLVK